jgi:transposase
MGTVGRPSIAIHLSDSEQSELKKLSTQRKIAADLQTRAQIVLLAAQGMSNVAISKEVRLGAQTVGKWRKRFAADGTSGLYDEQRPGAPRKHGDDVIEAVIAKTLQEKPKGASHWSTRLLAANCELSKSTIARVWQAFRLQPHRQTTFKLSADPLFIEKVRDVVGIYLNPPDKAMVLCVDEKSQIQALNRTQPIIPMTPGQVEQGTHDYERHGTTTLFAALDIATGKVVGQCHQRHRAEEFKKFLNKIKRETPKDLDIHLVMDNYATHKTPMIQKWLKRNERFHFHFVPTSSSWLNQVERWFGILTQRLLKRSVHFSVAELEKDLRSFIDVNNENPKPFVWMKTADEILESIARFCCHLQAEQGNL